MSWREWLRRPAREAHQLDRDAQRIIEDATEAYRAEAVRAIAVLASRRLDEARAVIDERPARAGDVLHEMQRLHRAARRRMDQVELTASTLVIIYLRAERLGAPAEPARAAIDAFLDRWRHAR